MIVSVKWLKQLLPTIDSDEIVDILPKLGHEIEEVIDVSQRGLISCQVSEIKKHPKEKNLLILKLVGNQVYQVVTGAKNMKVGDVVLLALPGGVVAGKKIEPVDFTGVKSEGMLVSEAELGLIEESPGIIILDETIEPGMEFNDLFDTVFLDLEITPNRGDCESVLGIARELSVALGIDLKLKLKRPKLKSGPDILVEDLKDCPRYTALIVENVKVTESPFSIKWRLFHQGIRPINSLVDITNYIMLMLGQPLHAFDKALIRGKVRVRRAKKNESIVTLDGSRVKLTSQHMLIADKEGPIAIAGVIGGHKAEISHKTNKILLESATFNPEVIRRSTRGLLIDTQSGRRFERGTDPLMPPLAAEAAAKLIGGHQLSFTDIRTPFRRKKIACDKNRILSHLGIKPSKKEISKILTSLDFRPKTKGNKINVSIPSYRRDINEECDISEEIARVYGYDRIPSRISHHGFEGFLPEKMKMIRKLRSYLISLGFYECKCFAPTSKEMIDLLGLSDGVEISNPLNERFTHLRPSLAPGLIEALANNCRNGFYDIRIFEIGRIFIPRQKRPSEPNYLGIIVGGRIAPTHWSGDSRTFDFFDAKGILEAVVEYLRAGEFLLRGKKIDLFANYSCEILIGGDEIGCLGQFSNRVLDCFNVEGKYFFMEINLDRLIERILHPIYIPYPKYPKVKRDLAFIVDQSIPAQRVIQRIKNIGGPLLVNIEIFDRYQGEKFPEGKVSLGFRLTFQPMERTLTDEEIKDLTDKVVSGLEKEFGAKLRDKEVDFGRVEDLRGEN